MRIAELELKYGDRFRFRIRHELYLYAEARRELPSIMEDSYAIYALFFFEDRTGPPKRSSSAAYLNVYDQYGTFQFQLAYDPRTGDHSPGKTEHY